MALRALKPLIPLSRGLTVATALTLTVSAGAVSAQTDSSSDGRDVVPLETSPGESAEATALQAAVRSELADIGITNLTIEKLSSPQLAGILMTLTATDRQDKAEAITAIAADNAYKPVTVDAEDVAENDTLRDTVEDALVRAGWSTDVSQLSDAQVAVLYSELATSGHLDPQRIEELVGSS